MVLANRRVCPIFRFPVKSREVRPHRSSAQQLIHTLWDRLYAAEPTLEGALSFFRDVTGQVGDVWCCCNGPAGLFGIQLDPDIEVICVWTEAWAAELGSWCDNAIAEAISAVREAMGR